MAKGATSRFENNTATKPSQITAHNLSIKIMQICLALLSLLQLTAAVAGNRPSADDQDERQLSFFSSSSSTCRDRDPFGLVVIKSRRSLDDTYDAVIAELDALPPVTIILEFDHSANAASVGLDLDPTRVVFFGNPVLGTPIMQANMFAGLDLPQKILVWEESDGSVFVGYNNPSFLVARFGFLLLLKAKTELSTMATALLNISSSAAGVSPSSVDVPRKTFLLDRGLIIRKSEVDFETTYNQLLTTIESGPATIELTFDHSANAASVDMDLGPSRLVVFGNPVGGTPFIAASQTQGIDSPARILVTEVKGRVFVIANDLGFLSVRHSFCDVDIAGAEAGLDALLTAATSKAY